MRCEYEVSTELDEISNILWSDIVVVLVGVSRGHVYKTDAHSGSSASTSRASLVVPQGTCDIRLMRERYRITSG